MDIDAKPSVTDRCSDHCTNHRVEDQERGRGEGDSLTPLNRLTMIAHIHDVEAIGVEKDRL